MARATTCIYENKEIAVAEAIGLKENVGEKKAGVLRFNCKECGEAVRPHKAGGNMAAHFEHLARNPNCKLSDPAR